MDREIMMLLIRYCNDLQIVMLCEPSESVRRDEPHLSVQLFGDDIEVTGCLSVARYMGRLYRIYPLDPQNALLVDSILERLVQFQTPFMYYDKPQPLGLDCVPDTYVDWLRTVHVPRALKEFEDLQQAHGVSCESDRVWLAGMDSTSLADLCWAAAFNWSAKQGHLDDDALDDLPIMREWCDELSVFETCKPEEEDDSLSDQTASDAANACAEDVAEADKDK